MSLTTTIIGEICVYISSSGSSLESILFHLYIVLCLVYVLFIYVSLKRKTDEIVELLGYLEKVVNER